MQRLPPHAEAAPQHAITALCVRCSCLSQLCAPLQAACKDAGLEMDTSSAAAVATGVKPGLNCDQFCALLLQAER